MAQIKWTEPALADLDELAEHIALDKPSAAKKFVNEVFQATQKLKTFPESGRKPPELENTDYRELIVGPCRLFYRADKDNNVYILYVMRSERELRLFMLKDRKGNR